MAIKVTRTYVGSIQNQQQVWDGLESLGDSTSKIWNVARWTADRIWNATGEIPDEGVLKAYMKNQSCWKDLNDNPVRKSSKNFPTLSSRGSAYDRKIQRRIHLATVNTATHDPRVRSRSKKMGSNTTPRTTASDSRTDRTSRSIGQTSCSASIRLAQTLTSQKLTEC